MGEKGLSGAHDAAGDDAIEPAYEQPDVTQHHGDDDRAWRPDYETEPAYASDDDPYAGHTVAAEG